MSSVASLTITDDAGNPVQFARIVVYLKADYDAARYTELGATETDANGAWLTPISLGGWATGQQFYVVAHRRAGSRVSADDGLRRFLEEAGPFTATIEWPHDTLKDNTGATLTDQAGTPLYADVALGTHSMSALDADGAALQDSSGTLITASAAIG